MGYTFFLNFMRTKITIKRIILKRTPKFIIFSQNKKNFTKNYKSSIINILIGEISLFGDILIYFWWHFLFFFGGDYFLIWSPYKKKLNRRYRDICNCFNYHYNYVIITCNCKNEVIVFAKSKMCNYFSRFLSVFIIESIFYFKAI